MIDTASIFLKIRVEVGNPDEFLLWFLLEGHGNSEILDEGVELFGGSFVVIFLDWVAHIVEDDQFEFSLHLGDGQLFVEALFLCC